MCTCTCRILCGSHGWFLMWTIFNGCLRVTCKVVKNLRLVKQEGNSFKTG